VVHHLNSSTMEIAGIANADGVIQIN